MPQVDAGEEINPWLRARQRVETREEINRGGMCSDFEESEKFHVEVWEFGKSLRVVALHTAIGNKSKNIFEINGKTLRNTAVKLEKAFQTIDLTQLSEEERILLLTMWGMLSMSFRNYEALAENYRKESTLLLEKVSSGMRAIEKIIPEFSSTIPDAEENGAQEVAKKGPRRKRISKGVTNA
jgi:hypothetical protein